MNTACNEYTSIENYITWMFCDCGVPLIYICNFSNV